MRPWVVFKRQQCISKMNQEAPNEASVRRKLSESMKEQVRTLGRYSTVCLVALGILEICTGHRKLGCVYTRKSELPGGCSEDGCTPIPKQPIGCGHGLNGWNPGEPLGKEGGC